MSRRRSQRASRRAILGSGVAVPATTLLAYSFSGAPVGNAGTLSSSYSGLNLSRASAATVQTSASTVDSTPATDQARIGSTGAAWGNGLIIEESRTNSLVQSRNSTIAPWAGGTNAVLTAAIGAGPDGTVTATRANVASNGFTKSEAVGLSLGAQISCSEWVRANAGTSPYQFYCNDTLQHYVPGSTTTTWQKVAQPTLTVGSSAQVIFYPCDALDNGGVGACDIWSDFYQVELGLFGTEAIVTAGASATRAGERLWISSAATVIDTNRMGLAFSFVAKGTPAQYSGAIAYLWWIDASNNAWIDVTQKLNVKLGGTTVTSASAIAWSAGDVVDLWIACGAGSNAVVEYRLNSGTKVVLINTALAGNPSGASTIDILCSGTSNQFSCWLISLTAYKTGQQPSWA